MYGSFTVRWGPTLAPSDPSYLTLAIRPHDPLCSRIAPPAITPTSLCLARTWALSPRTLAGNQTTGLVQLLSLLALSLPFLPTVCALVHSRYSNKVVTTFRGLHQLAIVESLHQRRVKFGQQHQLAESALLLLLAKGS